MENDPMPSLSAEPVDGGNPEKVTLADLANELHNRLSAMSDSEEAAALARAFFDPTIAWAPRPDQDRHLVDD